MREAADTIEDRAAQRDSDQERSMARCVAAFNGLTKHNLTEEEGWMFMVVLKMARALNGSKFVKDDYVDGAAYMALAGESAWMPPEVKGILRVEGQLYNGDKCMTLKGEAIFLNVYEKGITTVFQNGHAVGYHSDVVTPLV